MNLIYTLSIFLKIKPQQLNILQLHVAALSFQYLTSMNPKHLIIFSKTISFQNLPSMNLSDTGLSIYFQKHSSVLSFQNLPSMNQTLLVLLSKKDFAALSFRNLTSMKLQHEPRLCHTQVRPY